MGSRRGGRSGDQGLPRLKPLPFPGPLDTLIPMPFDFAQLLSIADLAGVLFFALSGAMLAGRLGYDMVGSVLLGAVTGLGGGVVRDVIIGAIPPAAFSDGRYLVPPLVASLVVYLFRDSLERHDLALQYFDAGGLGLFTVVGTLKGIDFGLEPWAGVFMGIATGVGGGVLRDVIANVPPMVVQRDHLYLVPALVGAVLTTVAQAAGWGSPLVLAGCVLVVVALRVLSLHVPLRVPPAVRGRR